VGSFNTSRVGAQGGLADGRWRLDAGINLLDTAGTNISRQGPEADGFDNLTSHVKVGWDVSDAVNLKFSLNHSDALNEFDGTDFAVTGLPTDADLWTERTLTHGQLGADFMVSEDLWSSLSIHRSDVDADNFTFGLGVTSATAATTDEVKFNTHLAWGEQTQHRLPFAAPPRSLDHTPRAPASPSAPPNPAHSHAPPAARLDRPPPPTPPSSRPSPPRPHT